MGKGGVGKCQGRFTMQFGQCHAGDIYFIFGNWLAKAVFLACHEGRAQRCSFGVKIGKVTRDMSGIGWSKGC